MKRIVIFIMLIGLMGSLFAQDGSFGEEEESQKFKTNLKLETIGSLRQLLFWPGYFNTLELELIPRDWENASLHFWTGGFYKTDNKLFGFIPINDDPVSLEDYGYQFGIGYRRYLSPFYGEKWEKVNGHFYLQPTVVYQRYWINEPGNPPQFSFEVESINALMHLGGQVRIKKKWLADISMGWGYQFKDPSGILIGDYVIFHPRMAIGYEIK